jgi:hypothetical protein
MAGVRDDPRNPQHRVRKIDSKPIIRSIRRKAGKGSKRGINNRDKIVVRAATQEDTSK